MGPSHTVRAAAGSSLSLRDYSGPVGVQLCSPQLCTIWGCLMPSGGAVPQVAYERKGLVAAETGSCLQVGVLQHEAPPCPAAVRLSGENPEFLRCCMGDGDMSTCPRAPCVQFGLLCQQGTGYGHTV